MAEQVLEQRHGSGGIGFDFAGLFDFMLDPKGAARRLPRRYFWITPLAVLCVVYLVAGIVNLEIVRQAFLNAPVPPNADAAQFQRQMAAGARVQQFFVYLSPVLVFVFTSIYAVVVMFCAMGVGIKTTFLQLFNFWAGLSIIDVLKVVATTVILRFRGEPTSPADLQPALGLDIFLSPNTNKALTGFVGYFNIFEVWQIAMAILIFRAFYRVTRGKALVAVLPIFVFGLIARVIGAVFAR